METKSRYEILKELNEREQSYIVGKSQLKDKLAEMERTIKTMKRNLEDFEEDTTRFKTDLQEKERTYDTLIAEVGNSIEGLSKLQTQGK